MQTIKIRNLESTEDNTITDNSYLALALNENDIKRGSEDPNDLNQRITVKTTISQLKNAILPSVGSSPPLSENEEGGIDIGIGDIVLDENGEPLVPQPPIVIKQGGKDQIKITDNGISLEENVFINKSLSVTQDINAIGGITTSTVTFNELSSDPDPAEGKLYRKSDGLYFNGVKILTLTEDGGGLGKWVDGDSDGDIVYNGGYVGIGTNPSERQPFIYSKTFGDNSAAMYFDFHYGNRAEGYTASGLTIENLAGPPDGDGVSDQYKSTSFLNLTVRSPSLDNSNHGTVGYMALSTPFDDDGTSGVHYGTGQIDFYIRNDSAPYGFPNSPRVQSKNWMSSLMTIKSDGNVGIGTTTPSAKLDVVSSSSAEFGLSVYNSTSTGSGAFIKGGGTSEQFRLKVESSENTDAPFVVKGDGNVGIGTETPSATLHVEGVNGEFKLRDTAAHSASSGPAIYLQGHNSDGNIKNFATINAFSSGIDTGDLAFNVRKSNEFPDEEVMRLDSDGNVGIGTTAPDALLDVEGSLDQLNSARIKNTSTTGYGFLTVGGGNGANRYVADFRDKDNVSCLKIDGNGNVSIGGPETSRSTSNTAYKLDVPGSARFIDWCTRYRTSHTDNRYNSSDYYLLLLQYDTSSYVGGELTGFRGSSSEAARTLHITFQANSTSYVAPGQTEGAMMMSKGPGMFSNQDKIGGFYSVVYNGTKYLALHFKSGTEYHAMTWEFQGRINLQTETNKTDFLKVKHSSDLSEITEQSQYTTINHGLYALDNKIGIGNAAPDYKLDVNGDINFTGNLYNDGVAFSGGTDSSDTITALNARIEALETAAATPAAAPAAAMTFLPAEAAVASGGATDNSQVNRGVSGLSVPATATSLYISIQHNGNALPTCEFTYWTAPGFSDLNRHTIVLNSSDKSQTIGENFWIPVVIDPDDVAAGPRIYYRINANNTWVIQAHAYM